MREHESATVAAARAEEALVEHEDFTREFLEDLSRRRKEDGTAIELVIAREHMRESLGVRRSVLGAGYREALQVVEGTLDRLIEARRDLRALEGLRAARHTRWRQEVDAEMQKQADEAHNARLLLDRIEAASPSGSAARRAHGNGR